MASSRSCTMVGAQSHTTKNPLIHLSSLRSRSIALLVLVLLIQLWQHCRNGRTRPTQHGLQGRFRLRQPGTIRPLPITTLTGRRSQSPNPSSTAPPPPPSSSSPVDGSTNTSRHDIHGEWHNRWTTSACHDKRLRSADPGLLCICRCARWSRGERASIDCHGRGARTCW